MSTIFLVCHTFHHFTQQDVTIYLVSHIPSFHTRCHICSRVSHIPSFHIRCHNFSRVSYIPSLHTTRCHDLSRVTHSIISHKMSHLFSRVTHSIISHKMSQFFSCVTHSITSLNKVSHFSLTRHTSRHTLWITKCKPDACPTDTRTFRSSFSWLKLMVLSPDVPVSKFLMLMATPLAEARRPLVSNTSPRPLNTRKILKKKKWILSVNSSSHQFMNKQ